MTRSKKKRSLFLIVTLTLLVGLGRGAAALAFLRPATPESQESDGAGSVRAVLQLETFTVDMSSPDQKVYLRAGIDVGLKEQILNALHHRAPAWAQWECIAPSF
jgi:flagellar basal body-associated protein FliL